MSVHIPMAKVFRLMSFVQRTTVLKIKVEKTLLTSQKRSLSISLEHTGKLEPEKSKDEPYDTGQVFLHNSFNYRGVILFPWHVRVHETVKTRKGEEIIMHPEMNPHEMASRIGKETNRDRTTYQWFYTVLMDPRDLSSHHPSVQLNSMTYLHQKDPSSLNSLSVDKGLKSESYFDYAFHEDICPYTSYEIAPIQHPRYYALMVDESSEHTREKFKEHHWLQLKDVYTQTTENIKVTVMPTYLGCRKEVTDDLDRKFYYWRYHIRIENLGDQTVTLRRRSWFTMALGDGRNQFQENKGAGVVGEQPRLTVRNNTFQYSSHVVLESHGGYMWGKFTMELDNGNQFESSIPQFNLDSKQSNKPNFNNIKGGKT